VKIPKAILQRYGVRGDSPRSVLTKRAVSYINVRLLRVYAACIFRIELFFAKRLLPGVERGGEEALFGRREISDGFTAPDYYSCKIPRSSVPFDRRYYPSRFRGFYSAFAITRHGVTGTGKLSLKRDRRNASLRFTDRNEFRFE